jgi:exopolyphosphatase / guanosine-5'-triphosphate,3'-diphosphate pyrophosphatase
MNSPPARFEFRIWGNRLDQPRQRLLAMSALAPAKESAETYILSRNTDLANVKIRDQLIDIKLQVEQQGRLERWSPVLKAGFPIDSRTLVEQVFPNLAVAPPEIARPSYTHGEFVRDLVRPCRDLAVVEVTKTRYAFKFDRYNAEFAQMQIAGGAESETVELESEDPAIVLRAIAQLRLNSYPNINYVRHLKMMIGMAPRNSAVSG